MERHQQTSRLLTGMVLSAAVYLLAFGEALEDYNAYVPGSFPVPVSDRVFEIPLDPTSLLVVIPSSLEAEKPNLEHLLSQKVGHSIPFGIADALQTDDLKAKDLILAGNIMNNPWLLELYMKRRAFSDAFFPGAGGVFIHPAKSVWDPARNALIIGVSRDEDLNAGFLAFLNQIKPGSTSIGVIHLLKTAHEIPPPLESVDSIFGAVRMDTRERPNYRAVANWGLMYFLTGERRWATLFRDGIEILLDRAKKSGKWVTEPWSNIYFALWNIFAVWTLIDDDPVFTLQDRQTVEEVLWGYTRYIQARPYLDEDRLPLYEPRQNHYTFLALCLDAAYRYYTEKYGLTGLESMADKVRRCFDLGQAMSYRPNDDGGSGYQVLAPSHYLYYALARRDLSFLESGRLRTLVDLLVATIDNRRDPVTFGDIGSYSHRQPGRLQMSEMQFFSLAAWFYKEGAYQWLYNWLGEGTRIDLDSWGPLALGLYATDLKPAPPGRWTGILPVLLDEASLRYSARRSESVSQIPAAGRRYFDKISYRQSFDPRDEYLLLDGTSTFAHGHEDGNTVTRLTWLDRVWLFDLHYIKAGPQEHNGVSVTRNGTQNPPPPLNELECRAEFEKEGFTLTTARDFNGADWERHIFWKKGRYFLFLDRIRAREAGIYRLENRWRTRGETSLSGNTLAVRQGNASFFIQSADSAPRRLLSVPDEHNGDWDYPYGRDETIVCLSRKETPMVPGSNWVFANLLYATEGHLPGSKELFKAGENLYLVEEDGKRELFGLDPEFLESFGLSTDCTAFSLGDQKLILFGLGRLSWDDGTVLAEEGGRPMSLELELTKPRGVLLVDGEVKLLASGVQVQRCNSRPNSRREALRLDAGRYELRLDCGPASEMLRSALRAASRRAVLPRAEESPPVDFGLFFEHRVENGAAITAACSDGEHVVCGSADGSVFAVKAGTRTPLFDLPGRKEVLAIRAADLDRDGRNEIICSDTEENLFCYDASGKLVWRLKTQKFFGRDANVTDIWVDDIDGQGVMTVLAATNGWKLYALRPDGSVRWESFIFYHPLTRVRVLKSKGKTAIAVGTVYQTPLNLVDPKSGAVVWKTWEQTGSETMSTTDYCGKHLRDMVFTDTDGDGEEEIVFGNEYHSIYALSAADGRVKWKAQVGDKITALALLPDRTNGEERILAATEAGEVYLLDRRQGRRLGMISLGAGITAMDVISGAFPEAKEILLATDDGRLVVLDLNFLIKASLRTRAESILGVYPAGKSGARLKFYVVGKKEVFEVLYTPLGLRPSRHY